MDISKANELYYTIAKDQYLFSDDVFKYYKLMVALERLTSTVEILEKISLEGDWNTEAVSFVVWINYADLLLACIDKISDQFSVSIAHTWGIFSKYHNQKNIDDKDFFRFMRAIVLPHALSLDMQKQKVFTNGKTAYCSHVVWDTNEKIKIVYYNADLNESLHVYQVSVRDCQEFVEKYYNEIDVLVNGIARRKKNSKNKVRVQLKNEVYSSEISVRKKCDILIDLTNKYGNIDDKTGISYNSQILKRCKEILQYKFYGKNKRAFDIFLVALDQALDDYHKYLCEQRTDEKLLDYVLSPHIHHVSYIESNFRGHEYFINKVIDEYENFDSYFERYEFDEFYEELKSCLSNYVTVRRNNKNRFYVLCVIATFCDQLQHNPKYQEKFDVNGK